MSSILVIGSSGFLGKNLSVFFKNKNYSVTSVSRSEFGNLADFENWESIDNKKSYAAIFFCVEKTGNQIFFEKNCHFDIFSENFRILSNFDKFLSSLSFPTKIYCFSSLWTAADGVNIISERELFSYDQSSSVRSLLAFKNCLFELVKKLNSCHSDHVGTVITTGTIFGPGDESDHLVPSLLRKLVKNPKTLVMQGASSAVRNYVFVDDLCQCIYTMIKTSGFDEESIIVTSEINMSVETIVKCFAQKFGNPDVVWGTRVDNFSRRIPDTTLFRRKIKMDDFQFESLDNIEQKDLALWVKTPDH